MRRIKSLQDQVIGKLKVMGLQKVDATGRAWWKCKCECGASVVVRADNLTGRNPQKSCGCLRRAAAYRLELTKLRTKPGAT